LRNRPKLFLTLSLLCITPLLVLSVINFRNGSKATEESLRRDLEDELTAVSHDFEALLREREDELIALARAPSVRDYLRTASTREPVGLNGPAKGRSPSAMLSRVADSPGANELPDGVKREVLAVLSQQRFHASIACASPSGRLMFIAEPGPDKSGSRPTFRTKDLVPGLAQPDERIWTGGNRSALCSIVPNPALGELLRCTVPVIAEDEGRKATIGALVADFRLDSLFSQAARGWELSSAGDKAGGKSVPPRQVIVLDTAGKIVYHTNDALRHQLIGGSIPHFAAVGRAMTSGQSGWEFYESSTGDQWLAVYAPVKPLDLSMAVVRDYSLAAHGSRVFGWTGIALSILIGVLATFLLTFLYQRKITSIERVSEGVAAIAGGELDQRLQVRSSDDLRLLADSVNLMTERLREQIAHEAETRQFESFAKLSAMLTHDLKNAIEGLSLMVSNMERHFDNPEFRADAMKSLTAATDKLRTLVTRLSNPVNTLSGEFKMPRPTDLVPLLKRVLAQTANPLRETHQIEVKFPASLYALIDGERIEKVMENLVLNALEAMTDKNGKLTVEAGPAGGGKVFFSVTDTGAGMSPEFIKQRLFRPFATRKTHGVGLGLYTCREVVRANGGAIEVESAEGSGTTFRVVLASAQIKKRD
jgi:signal transduction histidine kinase